MTEQKTITGIVKSLKKDRKGLQLNDGNWYSNKFFKGELTCQRGDEVEITLSINGQWQNLVSCKVLKAAPQSQGKGPDVREEQRPNVDSGNCLVIAKELFIAGKCKTLKEAQMEAIAAFRWGLEELKRTPEPLGQKSEKEEPQEEVDPDVF